MKHTARILGLFLAVLMMTACLPLSVFAGGGTVESFELYTTDEPDIGWNAYVFPLTYSTSHEKVEVVGAEWYLVFPDYITPFKASSTFEEGGWYLLAIQMKTTSAYDFAQENELMKYSYCNGKPVKEWGSDGLARLQKNTEIECFIDRWSSECCWMYVLFPQLKPKTPPIHLELVSHDNPFTVTESGKPVKLTLKCSNVVGNLIVNWFDCDENGIPFSSIVSGKGLEYTIPGIPESKRGEYQYLLIQAFDDRQTDGMAEMVIEYRLEELPVTQDTAKVTDAKDTAKVTDAKDTAKVTDAKDTAKVTDAKDTAKVTDAKDTAKVTDAKDTAKVTDTKDTAKVTDTKDTSGAVTQLSEETSGTPKDTSQMTVDTTDPSADTKPDGTTGPEKDGKPAGNNLMTYILIGGIALIVIAIILFVLLLVTRGKKDED